MMMMSSCVPAPATTLLRAHTHTHSLSRALNGHSTPGDAHRERERWSWCRGRHVFRVTCRLLKIIGCPPPPVFHSGVGVKRKSWWLQIKAGEQSAARQRVNQSFPVVAQPTRQVKTLICFQQCQTRMWSVRHYLYRDYLSTSLPISASVSVLCMTSCEVKQPDEPWTCLIVLLVVQTVSIRTTKRSSFTEYHQLAPLSRQTGVVRGRKPSQEAVGTSRLSKKCEDLLRTFHYPVSLNCPSCSCRHPESRGI